MLLVALPSDPETTISLVISFIFHSVTFEKKKKG